MPLGRDLIDRVADSLKVKSEHGHLYCRNEHVSDAIRLLARDADEEANDWFREARFIEGVQLSNSIDDYLYTHRDKGHLIACAKLAIVSAIAGKERQSPLFVQAGRGDWNDEQRVLESWLRSFMAILSVGVMTYLKTLALRLQAA